MNLGPIFWYGFGAATFVFVGIPYIFFNWHRWIRAIICLKYGHLWYVRMMFENVPEWGLRECLCCGQTENFNPTTNEKYPQLFRCPDFQLWSIKDCVASKGNIH